MLNMKKFINYIYYGFYQIDYVFGLRDYRTYNIRTGGILFGLSIVLYIWSIAWAIILPVIKGLTGNTYDITDNDIWLLSVISGLPAMCWLYYWDAKEKYRKDFEELDKKPSIMRWICFLYAIVFTCGGVFFLLGCRYVVKGLTGNLL